MVVQVEGTCVASVGVGTGYSRRGFGRKRQKGQIAEGVPSRAGALGGTIDIAEKDQNSRNEQSSVRRMEYTTSKMPAGGGEGLQ